MKSNKALLHVREAFMVKRYHTVPHHITETVGHHTCNVIAILIHLEADYNLIKAALIHDAAEGRTGDMPATCKWDHPEVAAALEKAEKSIMDMLEIGSLQLTEEQNALLKFADMMDLCFKSVEELAMGNMIFSPILARGMNYCRALLSRPLKNHVKAHALYVLLFDNEYISVREIVEEPIHSTMQ